MPSIFDIDSPSVLSTQRQTRYGISIIPNHNLPSLPFEVQQMSSQQSQHRRFSASSVPFNRQISYHQKEDGTVTKKETRSRSLFSARRSSIETVSGTASFSNRHEPKSKTRVINLPWTDIRGSSANYTGEVSELIQPHGFGFLVYKDGTVFQSNWCNGMPVRDSEEQPQHQQTPQNRCVLDLGQVVTPNDNIMKLHPSPEWSFEDANLPIHSFAFVLRSDGQWTYAIVADRPVLDGPEASIRFVVDRFGKTKVFKRKHWRDYIRLVRDENDHEDDDVSDGGDHENIAGSLDQRLASFRRAANMVSITSSTRTNDGYY